jgi:MarR family 2-MHQ and catechol resistance regulon transcriptional repressor
MSKPLPVSDSRTGDPEINAAQTADPSLPADAAALHRVLLDLKRVYQFRDRDQICCHDISVTQYWALEALERAGTLTLNELAAQLYLDKSTASRVIDALERKGYVKRSRHRSDGRALALNATPAGRQLFNRIETDIQAYERGLMASFDHEVRVSLVELLERLVEAASAGVRASGGTCCSLDR